MKSAAARIPKCFRLPPICNSNGKNMQNRPDGGSQPAIPRPISELFLCLFFCTLLNKTIPIKKKRSTNLKINRFAHLLNSSIIRRSGVNSAGLSTFRSCHSTVLVMASSGGMPVFVRLPQISDVLTLTSSICLHVLCQFSHKKVSITSPSTLPKTGPGILVLQP